MDGQNNSQRDEARGLIPQGAKGATNGRMQVATLPIRPVKEPSLPPAQLVAQRRARVNRILMRKRRHERLSRDLAPRLLIASVVVTLVLFSLFSTSVGTAYAYYRSQLSLLNGIANHTLFQTTHIYDRNGKLLYELYDPKYGRRTYVNYNDVSPFLAKATVAAEDHTFWENSGVDLQGIIRAAYSNLQNQSVVEGGSTITQQLIKNQFFSDQPRSIQVKEEEVILAYGLTQQYPKWKIMEMYLNTVYYGDLNYGIEAAAEDYFNLQPTCTTHQCTPAVYKLDLAQASLLAGLPQSPSYYNPVINKQAALDRQKLVLQSMVGLGMITPNEATHAETEMAKYTFKSYANDQAIKA